MTTRYYRFADGSIEAVEITGERGDHIPPEGATEITEEEYESTLADIRAAREARRAQQQQEDEARTRADYEALRSLGVPEGTARRLSGYMGGADTRPGEE